MNIDKQYQELLKTVLEQGVEKEDRTGTGTKSIFGYTIRHHMKNGFPLLTTKKMAWKSIVTELLWFLQGRTDLRYLLENGCHIWTGDAYKKWDKDYDYEHPPFSGPFPPRLTHKEFEEKILNDPEFEKMYGDLGPIYGKQWRSWDTKQFESLNDGNFGYRYKDVSIDQIQNLINGLKTNPDSRRLMVSAWNPGELDQMTLPPCHYGFQVYARELSAKERYRIWFDSNYETGMEYHSSQTPDFEDPYWKPTPKRAVSLMWNQRSVDTFLGLPFNIASYALLLAIIGEITGYWPEYLIGNLGDTHLYSDHLDQAREQISREPFLSPSLRINTEFWLTESGECGVGPFSSNFSSLVESMQIDDFQIEHYKYHPTIKAPLSN
jgi:thymidylate synthase